MFVNVEFLGSEPIENVITNMHFRMDKTIYFGYREVLEAQRYNTDRFLKRYCGVDTIEFHALSKWDLQSVLEEMREVLRAEYDAGNQVFFDITGGENLVLVAFGILSKELETPMHLYDVEQDKLIELDEGTEISVSRMVPRQTVKMDLDKWIQMRGGVINYRRHKKLKSVTDPNFEADLEAIWNISKKYGHEWNAFADFMKQYCQLEDSLYFVGNAGKIEDALKKNNNPRLRTTKKFNGMLDDCQRAGILLNVEHRDGLYRFTYKNDSVKSCLCDPGSILELHVFLQERKKTDDCRVGVHVDWDGVIQDKANEDVLNEVDVLTLNGNIPTFISCKNGSVNQMALYELGTIAAKFGGKYAKKAIAAPQGLYGAHALRAEEMNIAVLDVE